MVVFCLLYVLLLRDQIRQRTIISNQIGILKIIVDKVIGKYAFASSNIILAKSIFFTYGVKSISSALFQLTQLQEHLNILEELPTRYS